MSGRVLGTTAADAATGSESPRRRWPLVLVGVALLAIGGGVARARSAPVRIDDEVTKQSAAEIARLLEVQLDAELALLAHTASRSSQP